MNLYNAWVIFCIISASFIFSYKKEKIEAGREVNVDGLRYILAAFVVFHHNSYSENFFATGHWKSENSVITYAGTFGVSVFFMITGYLFGEIKKETNWMSFFIKRSFRIIPIFYISSIACVVISAYIGMKTGWKSNYHDLIYWFDGGISGVKPSLFGAKVSHLVNAGVTWTLYWEWMFYFSLPLLSFIFNKKYTMGLCIFSVAIIANVFPFFKIPLLNTSLILFFAIGVLARNLKNYIPIQAPHITKNIITIAILIYCLFISGTKTAYNTESAVFIGVFFYMIISGANLFGFLTNKGSVLLGDASYSIYLLHGIAWYVMNKTIFHFNLQHHEPLYYLIQTLTWYTVCFISVKSYHHIEKPFMAYGKKLALRIERKAQQGA